MGKLPKVNKGRLWNRLEMLAKNGATPEGGVSRLALSAEDKAGRDLFVSWLKELGMPVHVDKVGNIIGIRPGQKDLPPVMIGSHLDTVRNGGRFDGAYGVLGGLEVLQVMNEDKLSTRRPVAVIAFTNEEDARYVPDMQGSLAFCGDLSAEAAWAVEGFDGSNFGAELKRIGYAGEMEPGAIRPYAYVELHIEQGPILDRERIPIGVVETVVGISWQELTLTGLANHAGTTPTDLRHDAGLVAARIIIYLRELAESLGANQRATCGMVSFQPDVINVIPGQAVLTVDLRNPEGAALRQAEQRLAAFAVDTAAREGVGLSSRQLVQVPPVQFHPAVVAAIEGAVKDLKYPFRRMISGAGHDAQMMARTCPAAMIFVPSREGISHSPREYTPPEELEAGANVLLRAVLDLADHEEDLQEESSRSWTG